MFTRFGEDPFRDAFPMVRLMMSALCRCLALTGLLILELFLLTIHFDTKGLDFDPRWWAGWMGEVYLLPRFAITMAGALLLFAGKRMWEALPRFARELQPLRWAAPALFGHFLTVSAFISVSSFVFGGDTAVSPDAGLWVIAWWLLGFLSVAFLALSVFPLGVWTRCLWRGRWILAAAAAVAAVACLFGWATDLFWRPLGQGTLWAVQGLLRVFGVQTVSDPASLEVGTTSFRVMIGPGCSGYEGIGLFWAFIGVYLWLFRKGLCFPQALLLIPVGTALMWCCNALRIAALIALGSFGSEAIALGGFHSQVGWLSFNAVALGLVAANQRLGFFATVEKATARPEAPGPAAPYLAPFLAVLATGMITIAFTAGFDYYYPVRLLVGGAVLFHYRRSYTALRSSWSWPAVAIGTGVFVLWVLLDQLQTHPGIGAAFPLTFANMGRWWTAAWLVCRLAGFVVLAPFVEELAFRGYLISWLRGDNSPEAGHFTWLSFLVSSLLFGLFHQDRWLAGTLAGLGYALALYRRRRLLDAVLAHATTNALIAVLVVVTQRWSLWG